MFDSVITSIIGIVGLLGFLATNEKTAAFMPAGTILLALFAVLGPVLAEFTAITAALAGIGRFTSLAGGLKAIGLFDAIVADIVAIVTGLGLLYEKVDGFPGLMEKGGEMFEKIGYLIGAFFGNVVGGLVGGVATAVSGAMITVADDLAAFAEHIQPFLDAAGQIDSGSLDGVRTLADTVKELSKAGLLESIARFFGAGLDSNKLGQELCDFAPYLAEFNDALNGSDFSGMAQAAEGAKYLAEFANALPRSGGWLNSILGDRQSLESFSNGLKKFGPALRGLSDLELNQEAVQSAVNAGKMLSELEANLPASGGVLQDFLGSHDMAKFGKDIAAFGQAICDFDFALRAHGEIDEGLIQSAINAGTTVAELQKALPASGGWAQTILGEHNLTLFASNMLLFAEDLCAFDDALCNHGDIDQSLVDSAINAGRAVAGLQNELSKTGGASQWFTGERDLSKFGENLQVFGDGILGFYRQVQNIDRDSMQTALDIAGSLVDISGRLDVSGGFDGFFNGSKNLGDFGAKLEQLGRSLGSYSESVRDINWDSVTKSVPVIDQLIVTASNLPESMPGSVKEFKNALKDISDGVSTTISNINNYLGISGDSSKVFQNIGNYIVKGFVSGLNSSENLNKVRDAAKKLAETAKKEVEYELDIGSPSKVFAQLGEYTVVGFSRGILASLGLVSDAISTLGQEAVDGITVAVQEVQDALDVDAEFSPVVSPVLDLSGVRNGAAAMDGLLRPQESFKMAAQNGLAVNASLQTQGEQSNTIEALHLLRSLHDDFSMLSGDNSRLMAYLDHYLPELANMQVVMDSGALVGQVQSGLDSRLGSGIMRQRRQ